MDYNKCFMQAAEGIREPLNKSQYFLSRHTGVSQYPVKIIAYWMPTYAYMTVKVIVQKFLSYFRILGKLSGTLCASLIKGMCL
jgi:hypothetical protein